MNSSYSQSLFRAIFVTALISILLSPLGSPSKVMAAASGTFTIPARTTLIYALAESGQYKPVATATVQSTQPLIGTPTTELFTSSTPVPTPSPQASLSGFFTLNAIAVGFLVLSLIGLFVIFRSRQSGGTDEQIEKKGKKRR